MVRSRRHRLGQCFLVDEQVVERIAGLLEAAPPRVFEIGPGRGSLTKALAGRFPRVLALELDERLLPELRRQFSGTSVDLRSGDALTEPLEPLLAAEAPWQVAANLPYSVGTAILRRLLPRYDLASRVVVMLQREVAQRVVAAPGDRNHGLLALEREAYAGARIAFQVGAGAFRPRPKVESSVLVIEPRCSRFDREELGAAFSLARHALTMPRKKLVNALKGRAEAVTLDEAVLDRGARPGDISLDGWVALGRAARRALNGG